MRMWVYTEPSLDRPAVIYGGLTKVKVVETFKHPHPRLASAPTLWVCKVYIEPWFLFGWTWKDFIPPELL